MHAPEIIAMTRRKRRGAIRAAVAAAALAFTALAPGGAGAQDGAGLTATCPGVQAADSYDQRPVGPLDLGVDGDTTDYKAAGATLAFESHLGDGYLVITVTYQGVRRRLTTEGHDFGGHYPSRTPGPADTEFGSVTVTVGDQTWLSLGRNTSGQMTGFVWRIDGPCGAGSSPTSPAAPATAPGADPVSGASTYTG